MIDVDIPQSILLFIVILIICYVIWIYITNINHEYVKNEIDGNAYRVQKGENSVEASNLIAEIVNRCETLIQHLRKRYPSDPRVKNLYNRFDPSNITEGENEGNYTSYSVNKGEKIVLCLRTRDAERKLIDINTMMFVVIHELAHLASDSIGHNKEFWSNFKWLLEESIDIGIYVYENYSEKPVKYCGIMITNSPA